VKGWKRPAADVLRRRWGAGGTNGNATGYRGGVLRRAPTGRLTHQRVFDSKGKGRIEEWVPHMRLRMCEPVRGTACPAAPKGARRTARASAGSLKRY
jgi:hypothetical protein